MNVVRCKNGHFFDADAYGACPHCGEPVVFGGTPGPVKPEKKGGWGKKRKEKKQEVLYTGNVVTFNTPQNLGAENTQTEYKESVPVQNDVAAPKKKEQTLDFWQTSSHSGNEPAGQKINQTTEPVEAPVASSVYHWNPKTMAAECIVGFLVRYELDAGRPPIIKVTFDGEKLKVMNTINGIRDGGMKFPQDYFAEREIPLSPEQLRQLYMCLQAIHLENWKTSDTILGWLESPPPGFFICNCLSVTFSNGSRFECLEPRGESFNYLVQQLRELCEPRPVVAAAPAVQAESEQRTIVGTVEEPEAAPVLLPKVEPPAPAPKVEPEVVSAPASDVETEIASVPVPVAELEVAPAPVHVVEPETMPVSAPVLEPEAERKAEQASSSLQEAVRHASASNEGKTMSYFSVATKQSPAQEPVRPYVEPVVGWLVCIGGCRFGQCFSIFAGKNAVGRGEENRIVIADDHSISRNKHAFIIYEPKKRDFFIQPGDTDALTYVNEECIFQPRKLSQRDMIELGDSKFMFVPLCTESFSWEEYMNK